MAIGRISGPLLKSNLLRDGNDLAFETDLLYLDVNTRRIGVNNSSPTTDLDVTGTTRTTNLVVDNQQDIGNLTITGNTISSTQNTISFAPSGEDPTIYHSKLQVDDFEITGNVISTTVSNSAIELRPNGTGTIELVNNTNITGNLSVSGNVSAVGDVTIGGNITIGDDITDTITINASIQSDIVPESDNLYDLGSPSKRWRAVYVNNFITDTISVPELTVGDITISDTTISSATGTDITLDGNGAGGVRLGNFYVVDNTITNVVDDAVSIFAQSGDGYFKIDTTNGFVPPVGTNAERPTAYAVIGMTRYNTDSVALEVWNGSTWASPAGASGAVSESLANDISASYALMLG